MTAEQATRIRRRRARSAAVLAAGALAVASATTVAAVEPPRDVVELQERLLAGTRAALTRAEADGAKNTLPTLRAEAWAALAELQARIALDPAAAETGALAGRLQEVEAKALRLASHARLVDGLRRQKRQWEAVIAVYERDLGAAARAAGVMPPAELGGTDLARALVDSLGNRRLRCQGLADSLLAERRLESETLQLELAERDSTLSVMQRRLSDMQQSLWEMELKAGIAIADRAAVEARLRRQRERAETIRRLADEFGREKGEVALTADGAVVLRLPALAFGPNETDVTPAMEPALAKLTAAIVALGGLGARVEGHTDNTGSRATNRRLAQARAEAVGAVLRERLGWPLAAIEALGVGQDRPIAHNTTAAGRARNRRIDVIVPSPPDLAP